MSGLVFFRKIAPKKFFLLFFQKNCPENLFFRFLRKNCPQKICFPVPPEDIVHEKFCFSISLEKWPKKYFLQIILSLTNKKS